MAEQGCLLSSCTGDRAGGSNPPLSVLFEFKWLIVELLVNKDAINPTIYPTFLRP